MESRWISYEEWEFERLYYKALELMMFRYGIGPFPFSPEERNRIVEETMKEIKERELNQERK